MDIRAYNRAAWDREVERRNRWTIPVDSEAVERARHGDFSIVLTPVKPVPRDWFPTLENARVLCLASGGGQQGPILAAAGATSLFSTIRRVNWRRINSWPSAIT